MPDYLLFSKWHIFVVLCRTLPLHIQNPKLQFVCEIEKADADIELKRQC